MTYFVLEPEVAGSLGENTVLDRTAHPPRVTKLHYVFDGWLGDPLLESFPAFIVTSDLKARLQEAGLKGAEFESVEISRSEEFMDRHPGRALPEFERLLPTGQAGRDDIGAASDGRLVVSERALGVLRSSEVENALVEPFEV